MQSDAPHNASKASRHEILNRDEGTSTDAPPLHHHIIHLRTQTTEGGLRPSKRTPAEENSPHHMPTKRRHRPPRHAEISQPSATGAMDELSK